MRLSVIVVGVVGWDGQVLAQIAQRSLKVPAGTEWLLDMASAPGAGAPKTSASVRQFPRGSGDSPGRALNRLLAQARGSRVLFLDAGMLPGSGLLAQHGQATTAFWTGAKAQGFEQKAAASYLWAQGGLSGLSIGLAAARKLGFDESLRFAALTEAAFLWVLQQSQGLIAIGRGHLEGYSRREETGREHWTEDVTALIQKHRHHSFEVWAGSLHYDLLPRLRYYDGLMAAYAAKLGAGRRLALTLGSIEQWKRRERRLVCGIGVPSSKPTKESGGTAGAGKGPEDRFGHVLGLYRPESEGYYGSVWLIEAWRHYKWPDLNALLFEAARIGRTTYLVAAKEPVIRHSKRFRGYVDLDYLKGCLGQKFDVKDMSRKDIVIALTAKP